MIRIRQGRWSIACVCMVLGFMVAVQLRTTADMKASVSYQRIEEITARLLDTEQERDGLKEELSALRKQKASEAGGTISEDIRLRAGLTPVEGEGIIVKLEDSSATAKAGENPNLYLIHDDDLLKVINELRAAGAEAISINGQRLIGTSEIRCAGPTLSVNNVRSAPPFEIRAIGDSKSLESAIRELEEVNNNNSLSLEDRLQNYYTLILIYSTYPTTLENSYEKIQQLGLEAYDLINRNMDDENFSFNSI